MLIEKIKERILGLVEKPLLDEKCEIAEIVVSRYKSQSTLRLLVYSGKGATLEECSRISRIVGALVDETDLFKNGYTLEVSSTGLDRPLTTSMDFRYRIGETVKIKFAASGKKNVVAKIVTVENDNVGFIGDDGNFVIHLDEMEQAKIVY